MGKENKRIPIDSPEMPCEEDYHRVIKDEEKEKLRLGELGKKCRQSMLVKIKSVIDDTYDGDDDTSEMTPEWFMAKLERTYEENDSYYFSQLNYLVDTFFEEEFEIFDEDDYNVLLKDGELNINLNDIENHLKMEINNYFALKRLERQCKLNFKKHK